MFKLVEVYQLRIELKTEKIIKKHSGQEKETIQKLSRRKRLVIVLESLISL